MMNGIGLKVSANGLSRFISDVKDGKIGDTLTLFDIDRELAETLLKQRGRVPELVKRNSLKCEIKIDGDPNPIPATIFFQNTRIYRVENPDSNEREFCINRVDLQVDKESIPERFQDKMIII